MKALQYNFPAIKVGDTFKLRRLFIKVNNLAVDLTDAIVTLEIKYKKRDHSVVHSMDLYISDALAGEITLRDWDVDIKSRDYYYSLTIKTNDGRTATYMEGIFPAEY